jgi:hypothetical protein
MKILSAATIALLAGATPALAQLYPPVYPAPTQMQQQAPLVTPANQLEQQALPPWMQDDGSSSDHPIHNADDNSAAQLNTEYQGGLPAAPGHGFPAYPVYPAYPR